MDKDIFVALLEEATEVHTYSGRFMYGKCCISIQVDEVLCGSTEVIQSVTENLIANVSAPTLQEVLLAFLEEFGTAKIDQFGSGYVLYWPHISATTRR